MNTEKPKVKICGITNLEDALFCVHMGAEALGFIFYNKSPRYIEPSKASMIIRYLPPSTAPVGVFVNESRSKINAIAKQTGIRTLQLSGDESAEDCNGFTLEVWKSFRMSDAASVETTKKYTIAAAMIEGANDDEYGGSGKLPHLPTAIALKKYHRVILAGGLTPQNVVDTIEKVQPYAVDVNSGVEMVPGKKDHRRVRMLFEQLGKLK